MEDMEKKVRDNLKASILNLLRSSDPKQYYGVISNLKDLLGMSFNEYEKLFNKLQRDEQKRNHLCNTHITARNSLGMGPW